MSQAEADDKSSKGEDKSCSLYLKEKNSPSDKLIVPAELNKFLLHRICTLKTENGNLRHEVAGAREALEKLQKSSDVSSDEWKRSNEAAAARIAELNERCEQQAAQLEDFKGRCEKLEQRLASRELELERLENINLKNEQTNRRDFATMTEEDEEAKIIQARLSEKEDQTRVLSEKLDQTNLELGETKKTCILLGEEIEKIKKIREEHREAELVVLKEKCEKLEQELARKKSALEEESARKKVQPIDSRDSSTMTEEAVVPASNVEDLLAEKEDQVRILTEKLQQTSAKLYETKNACTSLRQEVNKAQKLLCREIGDNNVTIASLSNRPSGWRGRAEQVQQLQQKVADLQSKLSSSSPSSSSYAGIRKSVSPPTNMSPRLETVLSEQRNVDYLRHLERERRQQLETTARHAKQAELALEETRKKLQAARARIRVLENELNGLKTNLALLNEKRIHDDQLVEALNGQLRAVEEKYRERQRETRYQKEKAEETCRELREELSAVTMQAELLRKKLGERETEIDNLKAKGNGDDNPRVPELPRVPQPFNPIQSRPPTPRVFGEPNEYVALSVAAEAERQRLLELVTLLNRRLDKERTDTDQISELLRRERNKNAKLETRIQRLEMERVGMARVNTGYRARSSKSFVEASKENLSAEKIQFKLELLEEECLALKARLATVQQDKATDLAIYKKMLEQARRTFQDAFRGKMSYTAGCHSNVTI